MICTNTQYKFKKMFFGFTMNLGIEVTNVIQTNVCSNDNDNTYVYKQVLKRTAVYAHTHTH